MAAIEVISMDNGRSGSLEHCSHTLRHTTTLKDSLIGLVDPTLIDCVIVAL